MASASAAERYTPAVRAKISASKIGNTAAAAARGKPKPKARASGVRNLIEIGVPARLASEQQGPFATNMFAREWALVAPDGTTYRFRNLRLFVREHAHLFAPEDVVWVPRKEGSTWCRAVVRLAAVARRDKRRKSWQGWSAAS